MGTNNKKGTRLFTLTQKYIKNIYFLKPILSHPYLCPYIYWVFHAKFQDSRTNNKKGTRLFTLTQKYIKNIYFLRKIQNRKKFCFLKPILSHPYLCPYIYRVFHAKFQDS